ncbi:MAG TPA: hypothetical protein VF530_11695 [Planctomycetota bacterium]
MRFPRPLWLAMALVGCRTGDAGRATEEWLALQRENDALRMTICQLEERLAGGSTTWHPPQIEAALARVDLELRVVVLEAGSDHGVVAGYRFDVYRGKTYKGQVRIYHVEPTRSLGRILSGKVPMEPGDSATTHL